MFKKNVFFKAPTKRNYTLNTSVEDVKGKFQVKDDKDFYYGELTSKEFQVSLNFSFGSNLIWDANYMSKSDIKARGFFKEIGTKTEISLTANYPYTYAFSIVLMLIGLTATFYFSSVINLSTYLRFLLLPVLLTLGIGYFVNLEYERFFNKLDKYVLKLEKELNAAT